jgi:hypothetical protein
MCNCRTVQVPLYLSQAFASRCAPLQFYYQCYAIGWSISLWIPKNTNSLSLFLSFIHVGIAFPKTDDRAVYWMFNNQWPHSCDFVFRIAESANNLPSCTVLIVSCHAMPFCRDHVAIKAFVLFHIMSICSSVTDRKQSRALPTGSHKYSL